MFVLLHFIDEGTEYNLKQYLYIPIYMYVNYRTALKLIFVINNTMLNSSSSAMQAYFRHSINYDLNINSIVMVCL